MSGPTSSQNCQRKISYSEFWTFRRLRGSWTGRTCWSRRETSGWETWWWPRTRSAASGPSLDFRTRPEQPGWGTRSSRPLEMNWTNQNITKQVVFLRPHLGYLRVKYLKSLHAEARIIRIFKTDFHAQTIIIQLYQWRYSDHSRFLT